MTGADPGVQTAAPVDPALALVRTRMRSAVSAPGDRRDGLYLWLQYHLGFADAAGRPVNAPGGKGIRARLCRMACEAVGGSPDAAARPAAAIELTHEFSLIHDDIQDGDRRRRGRPTLWMVAGAAHAINAGDALFTIAREQLTDPDGGLAPATMLDLVRRYDRACLRLAEGQYLDIAFESAADVTLDDYVAMVLGKTGALLGAAAALGARAGGAAADVADAFARFGEALGAGFQMQDDVLGMWGDPTATGKPAGNDLARRKRSLPVVLALADPEHGPDLQALLAAPEPPSPADVAAWARRLEGLGVRARSEAMARQYAADAIDALAELRLRPPHLDALAAVARRAVARDR